MEDNKPTVKKGPIVILVVLVVILAAGLGLLYQQYNKMKTDNAIVQGALEEQKQSLSNELNDLMSEYEGLKSENDSMNNQIDKQQGRIKQLLAINASNIEKIKLYKNELTTLREIMKSYVVQIDSLNTRNQALTTENIQVKGKLEETQKSKENLEKEKQSLSSKVQMAAVLSAKNIITTPLNKRGKDTEKASRTQKVKVCFTLRENSLVEPGNKTVYLRILKADGTVLMVTDKDLFTYDSKEIAFSAKRDVLYEGKDVDLCVFWDVQGEIASGTYNIELYCDNKLIGASSFALK